jgi:tuftelin-interacting protein 11
VALYEAWYDLIPPFIQDNILDQLLLPKIQRAVSAWKPASGPSLQSLVFPWLPHVGLRMEEFLEETRRKVRSAFRAVDISHGIPDDLMAWKQVSFCFLLQDLLRRLSSFSNRDFNKLLIRHSGMT